MERYGIYCFVLASFVSSMFSRIALVFAIIQSFLIAIWYNNSAVDIPAHITLGMWMQLSEGLYPGVG